MKKFLMMLLCCLTVCVSTALGQTKADDILGTYKAVRNGVTSKVKITKHGDGYRAQVIWVDNLKNADGSFRRDDKNPDPKKRSVRADQIVLIDKVTYDDGEWKNGRIYDPTKGKTYKVTLSFKDSRTLKVKGSIGPFFENMYWTKIN